MKVHFFAPLIAAIAPLAGQDYWRLNHHFNLYADYGYIHRQDGQNLSLVEEREGTQCKTVISSRDLEKRLDWESAIRGGVIYNATSYNSLEATCTYFYPWMAKSVATGNETLFFPFNDPTFGDDYHMASRAIARYNTRLQSGELNYWGHLTPQRVDYFSFSWTAGARAVHLKEKLCLTFSRENDTSTYSIDTLNCLYGVQLGAMLQVNPSNYWTWTVTVKGAGLLNDASNEVDIRDQDDQISIRKYQKERWTDSWLLEAYGELAYHFGSHLSIHFGYQGWICSGLVIAPKQRDVGLTEKRRINTTGQIALNGLHAGLDLSF